MTMCMVINDSVYGHWWMCVWPLVDLSMAFDGCVYVHWWMCVCPLMDVCMSIDGFVYAYLYLCPWLLKTRLIMIPAKKNKK